MAHQLKSLSFGIVASATPSRGEIRASAIPEPRRASRRIPAPPAAEEAEPPLIAEAIAHELRATLALIAAYSQTVQHLPLDNDVRVRYLERISSASMSLAELADEVLAVAQEGRGREPLLQPLSLRHVYAHLESQMRSAADGASISVDASADLPLVQADPLWIALVVRNLVTNAIKYAPGHPVSISAWVNGDWIVTRVSDEGDGLPAAERRRLFEPVFRGRRARASGAQGSGRGLYLCKLMVEAHGGRIWVDETREGFAVAFSLPRATRPFFVADTFDPSVVAVGPGRPSQRGA